MLDLKNSLQFTTLSLIFSQIVSVIFCHCQGNHGFKCRAFSTTIEGGKKFALFAFVLMAQCSITVFKFHAMMNLNILNVPVFLINTALFQFKHGLHLQVRSLSLFNTKEL